MSKLGRQPSKKMLRDAIREMCVSCMGGAGTPGYRAEIARCAAIRCPLFAYRPFKGELKEAE